MPAPTSLVLQPPLWPLVHCWAEGTPKKSSLVIPNKTPMTETFWLIALPWVGPFSGPCIYLTDAHNPVIEVSNILFK